MKISEAFEPGYRKVTLSVIALVGVVLMEKFGGGLSQDTRDFILTVLGIFTGGNVLSKGIQAAKDVKISKQEVVSEDITEDARIPVMVEDIKKIVNYVNNLDKTFGEKLQEVNAKISDPVQQENPDVELRLKELSDRLDVQVQNVSKLISLVNQIRGPSGT